MRGVRVLVGTRKGAFVLTSDGSRRDWEISGPHFVGWEIYHVAGSPAEPDRLYASQASGWFGQVVQRSDDGGLIWEPQGNKFDYEGEVGSHQWYDGTPRPWDFTRVWHFEPSLTDPDTVYAGVEDAALFRSVDGAQTWHELPALRTHRTSADWAPGAGGMCLHTIILDPSDASRMYAAISAAGAFRSDDAGESWRPINGNLPTDFGFPIAIHAHEPDTLYVVPITSDSHHFGSDWVSYVVIGAARRAATTDGTDLCSDQNAEKGTSRRGPLFWDVCPAVSYSPTPWPVQYHRR